MREETAAAVVKLNPIPGENCIIKTRQTNGYVDCKVPHSQTSRWTRRKKKTWRENYQQTSIHGGMLTTTLWEP